MSVVSIIFFSFLAFLAIEATVVPQSSSESTLLTSTSTSTSTLTPKGRPLPAIPAPSKETKLLTVQSVSENVESSTAIGQEPLTTTNPSSSIDNTDAKEISTEEKEQVLTEEKTVKKDEPKAAGFSIVNALWYVPSTVYNVVTYPLSLISSTPAPSATNITEPKSEQLSSSAKTNVSTDNPVIKAADTPSITTAELTDNLSSIQEQTF